MRTAEAAPASVPDRQPILALEDLSLHDRGERAAQDLEEVTFASRRGVSAFVGESGSGKTMIARAIMRLVLDTVPYRGVERGPAREVIETPAHPYTAALLSCVPRRREGRGTRGSTARRLRSVGLAGAGRVIPMRRCSTHTMALPGRGPGPDLLRGCRTAPQSIHAGSAYQCTGQLSG